MTRRFAQSAFAVLVLGLLAACGGSTSPSASSSSAPSTTTTPAAPTAKPDIDVALHSGDAPQNPYPAFGSLWIAAHHANVVVRLDLLTGKTLARIPTGLEPGGITAGAGLVWVTHYGSGKLLVGISPKSNTVVRRVKLRGESCCQPAVLGSTVWVAAGGEDQPLTVGVNAASARIVRRISGVDGPVVVDGHLWASQDGVPVIDPDTQAPRTSQAAGAAMSASPTVDGLFWATRDGAAVGIDAAGVVKRTVFGPNGAKLSYTEGMAVTSGQTVWVVDGTSSLWRIDDGATAAVLAAHIDHDGLSIAGDGVGGVWVALFDAGHLQHFRGA